MATTESGDKVAEPIVVDHILQPATNATQDAVRELAREIGTQAMDVLDAIVDSDVFKTRLKASMTPLVNSLVMAATTHDAEIRSRVNQLLKPYSDQYSYVLYAGAGIAGSVILLLLVLVVLLFSVRVKFAQTS